MSSAPLLSVRDVRVELPSNGRWFPAVDGVSFDVNRGEALAIAGESGCGKTLLGRALLRLAPEEARVSGTIRLDGREIGALPERDWDRLRGARLAMLFQEPATALDPVRTIGDQIVEAIRLHRRVSRDAARRLARERLEEVAFPDPGRGLAEYGHRLSGGERQRALLAVALAASPEILIADEPTSALDATVAAEVLDLLARLRRDRGLTLLLVSHDLRLVARETDRALVLYAGRVVEEAATRDLFAGPRHPYTRGLLAAVPRLEASAPGRRFPAIPGSVPDLFERDSRFCAFAPRCAERFEPCERLAPELYAADDARVRCFLYDPSREAARG